MPDEGDVRVAEDGSLQAYLNGKWLNLGSGAQLVPPEAFSDPASQLTTSVPGSYTLTIGDNSDSPSDPPQVAWPPESLDMVVSGLDYSLFSAPSCGDYVITPGPHNDHPLPSTPPEGSVVVRQGIGLMVYKEGEWHEAALTPANISSLQNKVINNLTELVLDLAKRLEKLEKIVDVSSRFRKIVEEDD